jgi:hypothetical protein
VTHRSVGAGATQPRGRCGKGDGNRVRDAQTLSTGALMPQRATAARDWWCGRPCRARSTGRRARGRRRSWRWAGRWRKHRLHHLGWSGAEDLVQRPQRDGGDEPFVALADLVVRRGSDSMTSRACKYRQVRTDGTTDCGDSSNSTATSRLFGS